MKRTIFISLAVLMMAGCAKDELKEKTIVPSPDFTASFEDKATKTFVDSVLNLRWTADDRISIFTNTYNQEYRFTGKTGKNSGSFKKVPGDDFMTGNSIDRNYAVYPYMEDTEILECGEMTITLPAVQSYAVNTFGLKANTMVAVTSGAEDYFLPFKNLCGYLVLKLYGEATVKSISIKGNNGEKISGTAVLIPEYGKAPVVTVSSDGGEIITVDCGEGVPLGTTKETATTFWFVIPPVTFSKGFTVTATDTDGWSMVKSVSSSRTVQRNVKTSMPALEAKFDTKEGFITFKDSAAKSACVAKYDTDGDGEVSVAEAEAATSFNGLFTDWKVVTSFDEINYFKNVHSIDSLFYGCDKLVSITVPENITDLGTFAFYGCSSLTSVILPSGITAIGDHTFQNCSSLEQLVIPDGVTSLGEYAFYRVCMWKLELPATVTSIGDVCFRGISCVIVPSTSPVSIQISTFNGIEYGIFVPANLIETYKAMKYFSIYPSTLHPLSSYKDKSEFVLGTSGAIDMNTSVKWAAYNVDATKPEEYGGYYAWGETETKSNYDWSTYKYCDGTSTSMTKYCMDPKYGTVDLLTVLVPEDDVAHVKWGESWRMPTDAEWKELSESCIWERTTYEGINGRMVYCPENGNKVFLPAAGYSNGTSMTDVGSFGSYWSSSLYSFHSYRANDMNLQPGTAGLVGNDRYFGFSVRPVIDVTSISSISLNTDKLSLPYCSTSQLVANYQPSNATYTDLRWKSSDTRIAIVSGTGQVTAVSTGTCTITVYASNGIKDECTVTVTELKPEYVDLGLSVKWATFNVGASKPEEYGDHYAWGDIRGFNEGQTNFTPYGYKWCNGSYTTLTKYNTNSQYGTVDNKTVLEEEDDVAHVKWGRNWRMPTDAEWEELLKNCTCTWTTLAEVNGLLVTSKIAGYTDKSIFLPAAGNYFYGDHEVGCGSYYSSSLHLTYPYCAFVMDFSSAKMYIARANRWAGYSVRPVYEEIVPVTDITLNKKTLSLPYCSTSQLVANYQPSNATYTDLRWKSSDTRIAIVSGTGQVTAVSTGTCTITVYASNGIKDECTVTVTELKPEYVDLGLSVKWATFNVGASKPEEYGDYYAWGETSGYNNFKIIFDWDSYKYYNKTSKTMTKYCTESKDGTVDNKTVLEPDDDVAHVKWGGSWRIPTDDEWTELLEDCTWTWTTVGGVNGRLITSNKEGYTGKSIFLPAAGYRLESKLLNDAYNGVYRSSSLSPGNSGYACYVRFNSDEAVSSNYYRCAGLSVRPVTE